MEMMLMTESHLSDHSVVRWLTVRSSWKADFPIVIPFDLRMQMHSCVNLGAKQKAAVQSNSASQDNTANTLSGAAGLYVGCIRCECHSGRWRKACLAVAFAFRRRLVVRLRILSLTQIGCCHEDNKGAKLILFHCLVVVCVACCKALQSQLMGNF